MYFFVADLEDLCQKEIFSLDKSQTEHLWSCRVNSGQICDLTDLKGLKAQVVVEKVDKTTRQISFRLIQKSFISRHDWWSQKVLGKNADRVLFQAQMDKLYLEKWVEILPFSRFKKVFIFHSQFGPPQKWHFERLEKILIRSCCQAQVLYRPTIEFVESSKLKELLSQFQPIVLDCQIPEQISDIEIAEKINSNSEQSVDNLEENGILKLQKHSSAQKNQLTKLKMSTEQDSINFLIGPEGGFSIQEKENFQKLGLKFQNLGTIIYPAWLACLMV